MAKKEEGLNFADKSLILFTVLFIVSLLIYIYQDKILSLLQASPGLYLVFTHVKDQITQSTLLGLAYASFFGSLFFIMLPIEVIFVYYLSLDYPSIILLLIALSCGLLGMAINYGIGSLLGAKILQKFYKDEFEKMTKILEKWGFLIIVIGNIFLLPIEILALIIGAARYSFKKFMLATAIGRTIKYISLIYFGRFLFEAVIPWIKNLV